MNFLEINKVQEVSNMLTNGEAFTHSQSTNFLIDKLGELTAHLAFVNEQMAVSKKILNKAKVKAYNSLVSSEVANELYFAPSLARDYVSGKLADDQFNYDLCERTSRSLVHTIDSVRTDIS